MSTDTIAIETIVPDKKKRKATKSVASNKVKAIKVDVIVPVDHMNAEETFMNIMTLSDSLPITPGGWKVSDGISHLISVEPRFKRLICQYGIPSTLIKASKSEAFDPFQALFQAIVHQQLATSAAESIHKRVISAIRNNSSSNESIAPHDVLNSKFEVSEIEGKRKVLLNGVVSGLSEAKAKYLRSLAEHFNDEDKLKNKDFFAMSSDELYRRLIAVDGLGPWSVHMFLIFTLHSPNVLPLGDLAIRKGLCSFLGISETFIKSEKKILREVEAMCATWTPYSSLASLYMWEIADELKKNKQTKTTV